MPENPDLVEARRHMERAADYMDAVKDPDAVLALAGLGHALVALGRAVASVEDRLDRHDRVASEVGGRLANHEAQIASMP